MYDVKISNSNIILLNKKLNMDPSFNPLFSFNNKVKYFVGKHYEVFDDKKFIVGFGKIKIASRFIPPKPKITYKKTYFFGLFKSGMVKDSKKFDDVLSTLDLKHIPYQYVYEGKKIYLEFSFNVNAKITEDEIIVLKPSEFIKEKELYIKEINKLVKNDILKDVIGKINMNEKRKS